MKNDNYSIEKKFLLNQLNNIKSDLLFYLSTSSFRKVKYDMLNSVELVIDNLKKYELIKEKEIE